MMLNCLQFSSLLLVVNVHAWNFIGSPKVIFKKDEYDVETFRGEKNYNAFLRLLYSERDTVLIGGRNVVYNISLEDLSEVTKQRIIWTPNRSHVDLCTLKGKSEDDCHNYIRVGAKLDDHTVFICGTNAYKPLCQKYDTKDKPIVTRDGIDGRGKCPYDPRHNSTAVLADGHLYTATVTDFSGGDPVIYREPLRTERSDLKLLNEPNFVGSVPIQDFMLFFFREPAVEYINCGKTIYSRVGRVCKNDKGGPHSFGDRWTSFLKSRLNCSLPGEYPFYFDEIQSISDVVEGEYAGVKDQLIYAVFNTPTNSIGASAVCAYSLRSILATFDGPFKEQEHMNSNWLPVPNNKVPTPRPGQCVNDSRTLPDMSVNFGKQHSLMDEAVPAYHYHPIFLSTAWQYRLSSIAVDSQIKTVTGEKVDVVFLGTDDGRVIKLVSIVGKNVSSARTVLIEEIQVLAELSPIRKLSIVRPNGVDPKLLIVSDMQVHAIPLQRCKERRNCVECVALQDPYCAWNNTVKECVILSQSMDLKDMKNVLQNVTGGEHRICPQLERKISETSTDDNDTYNNIITPFECPICTEANAVSCSNDKDSARNKIAVIYTADTIGLLVVLGVLATLILGFSAGYLCSRHFRSDDYTNMPLHSNNQHNRLADAECNGEGGCSNNKSHPLNIVVNLSPKSYNEKNIAADSKTLQKVKKTYI